MKKDEMKKVMDKHVESCNTKDKRKGYRASAWEECKALEMLLKVGC